MPDQWPPSSALPYVTVAPDAYGASADDERWGLLELFLAIQLLWGALLFLPGMQQYRMYIRALPYVASLGALVLYMRHIIREPLPPSCRWLIAALGLLALNLMHAETHLAAGIAHVIFQISIAAPMFWVVRTVRSEARFLRLLWVIFAASFVGAAIGVLQVYYPDRFLPPEFSNLGLALNPDYVVSLTYQGPDGRLIVRPTGLSDLPGGAAISGLATVLLGVALAVHGHRTRIVRALCFAAAPVGMTALYLTQVRSLTIMAVLSVLLFAVLRLRQGRILQGGWVALSGIGLVIASFTWAATVGGETIAERFSGLTGTGLFTTFQENRGFFLELTLTDLLFQFPLGAGLGRWGMMHVYFGDPSMWQAPPIHVEIQATGWLLDGGVLMWLFYGGALLSAVRFAYIVAVRGATDVLQYFGTIVLCLQFTVIGFSLAGPVFNTQLGLQFWTLTAALFGVVQSWEAEQDATVSIEEQGV